jgi:hypothetical protein
MSWCFQNAQFPPHSLHSAVSKAGDLHFVFLFFSSFKKIFLVEAIKGKLSSLIFARIIKM